MTNTLWSDDILSELLALQVRQVTYVPDAGHRQLIDSSRQHNSLRCVPLTSEEEGVALLAGAWLGGDRGVLLMQSSGVGNCVNMLSLTAACRLPLLMLITMRGQWGEFNPWQIPMGSNTQSILETCDVLCYPVDEPSRVGETVAAAGRIAFNGNRAAAVLLSQRLIGVKTFEE